MTGIAKRSKLLLVFLAMTLVVAAGCQAIGGLDLNQVLKNTLKVTSSESNQTIEFKLHFDESALAEGTEEEVALLRLFSSVKLDFTNVKLQDATTASLNGVLTLGDEATIDFSVRMSEQYMTVELEGANQPFVLTLSGEYLEGIGGPIPVEPDEDSSALDQESIAAIGREIIDIAGEYVINNLPNPDKIKASPVNEPINGVQTSMMHVQTEMTGSEIGPWLKKYVDALIADQEGLESMIKGIIDLLAENEALWESLGEINPFETNVLDAPGKEEFADEALELINDLLLELQEMLEEEALDEWLTDALVAKVDLYVDSKLDIRKQVFELSYTFEESLDLLEDVFPFTGFTVKATTEQWNVNGDVKAEEVVVSEDAFPVEMLMFMDGYDTLQLFDPESYVYDLLKNKLKIATQTYFKWEGSYYNPPILLPQGITLVALRDVAEAFRAEIYYDSETKTIEVYDVITDTTIELQLGSDIVYVNGVEEVWPFPATSVDGFTYVPARKLAETLGATIEWVTEGEDWRYLEIVREP